MSYADATNSLGEKICGIFADSIDRRHKGWICSLSKSTFHDQHQGHYNHDLTVDPQIIWVNKSMYVIDEWL